AVSVFTTIGIILTLITETVNFFRVIPIWDFLTGTVLKPLNKVPVYGVLPLIAGTVISTVIAMIVAAPIGLMTAIYLSEYASKKKRQNIKIILEVIVGIQSYV